MVLLNVDNLILIYGVISPWKHVIWRALKYCHVFGNGGKFGEEVDSRGTCANNGDTLTIEINLVCRPVGSLIPLASVRAQPREWRLLWNGQNPGSW